MSGAAILNTTIYIILIYKYIMMIIKQIKAALLTSEKLDQHD